MRVRSKLAPMGQGPGGRSKADQGSRCEAHRGVCGVFGFAVQTDRRGAPLLPVGLPFAAKGRNVATTRSPPPATGGHPWRKRLPISIRVCC